MLKSKASRTTNEAVRETFSIKRCQSSIAFKEGESAQRILTLAFEELKIYLKRKSEENSSIVLIANIKGINTRQAQILKIIHEQPNTCLSVKEVENRFSVSNFTARTDLEGLVGLGYLSELQINKVKRNYIKSDKFDSLMKNKL